MTALPVESLTERLTLWWWHQLPSLLGRVSRSFTAVLSEGVYVTVWPRLAAFMPIVALVIGFLAGWLRLGGAPLVFTQSIIIMALAIVLGFLCGQWGFLYVVGFALADFIIYPNPAYARLDLTTQLQVRVALLIMYVALGVLAVAIPYFVRQLRAQMLFPSTISADIQVISEVIFSALVSAGLVYLYIQSLPMLIRPFFIWRRTSPPVNAVFPAQEQVWIFALVAAIVVIIRVLIEYGSAAADPETIEEFADLLSKSEQPGLWERLPKVVRIVIISGIGTLFLAGLYAKWEEALVPFLVLLGVGLARWWLPGRLTFWPQIMERIPIIIRLIISLVAAYLLSSRLLAGQLFGSSFQPVVWALLVSLVCMAVMFPEGQSRSQTS